MQALAKTATAIQNLARRSDREAAVVALALCHRCYFRDFEVSCCDGSVFASIHCGARAAGDFGRGKGAELPVPYGRRLVVFASGASWLVQWEEGRIMSTHAKQQDAIRAAKDLVRAFPPGTCAAIVVRNAAGQVRTEWAYDRHSYPPTG